MANVHMIVGALVVLAFLVLVIVNILNLVGYQLTWVRPLSMVAAALLLLQYLLGFGLLGEGKSIPWYHYVIALLAILPVGFEHGVAQRQTSKEGRARLELAATVVTLVLVVIAYAIGQSHA